MCSLVHRRTTSGVILVCVCPLLPVTGVGCMRDIKEDERIRENMASYEWAIAGQRRLTQFMVPCVFQFNRDRFRFVRTDGQRYVVALASQELPAHPNHHQLYVIDAARGHLHCVVYTGLYVHEHYLIHDDYLVIVGFEWLNWAAGVESYRLMLVHLPDGKRLYSHEISGSLALLWGVEGIDAVGSVIRIVGRPKSYCEVQSCRRPSLT